MGTSKKETFDDLLLGNEALDNDEDKNTNKNNTKNNQNKENDDLENYFVNSGYFIKKIKNDTKKKI